MIVLQFVITWYLSAHIALTAITGGRTLSRGKCFTRNAAKTTVDAHLSWRINAYLFLFRYLSTLTTCLLHATLSTVEHGVDVDVGNIKTKCNIHSTSLAPRFTRLHYVWTCVANTRVALSNICITYLILIFRTYSTWLMLVFLSTYPSWKTNTTKHRSCTNRFRVPLMSFDESNSFLSDCVAPANRLKTNDPPRAAPWRSVPPRTAPWCPDMPPQPQADGAVRPRQVGDVPHAARGRARGRGSRGARARTA